MDRISQALKENAVEAPREIMAPSLNRLRKDPLAYFDGFMNYLEQGTRAYPLGSYIWTNFNA